ncbi:MAG: precorrin-6y C5,15-methyltransferase (decarboxylating) subunit CbiE [Clostridia bacterium]|nr:precorrin-6y C5,15-methyltransferase (decarboxylating) subunit CbiE [Clostridia bacterium]
MIYIIGAGCGSDELITCEAEKAIESCKNIIGSSRLTDKYKNNKNTFTSYKPDEIKRIIDGLDGDTAVLMSGDTGFYSGTKKLIEVLEGYETAALPGISSAVYFASVLKMPWQDWKLLSLHGQKVNIIGHIRENRYVFALLGGAEDIKILCEKLILYSMDDVILYVGENLSYENERITVGRPYELIDRRFDDMAVLLAVNNKAEKAPAEIDDSEFIRGKVPMTKSEVRTLSVAKLRLKKDSVVYDIGAGTGSVSIAAALTDPDITVYAVEKNEQAAELIEVNKLKFKADNVKIIMGEASEVISELERPTHAFIGGSSGYMEKIIGLLLEKNSDIRIVVNTVTLESLAEINRITKKLGVDAETVMLSVSKGAQAGDYTIMKAMNPVYIISFGGR